MKKQKKEKSIEAWAIVDKWEENKLIGLNPYPIFGTKLEAILEIKKYNVFYQGCGIIKVRITEI